MSIEALEGVTDQELFDEANSDEPIADEATEEASEPVEQPQEQPRDEQGKFSAKADEPEKPVVAEAAQAETVDDKAAVVPSFRLKEEADARRRLENDLAQERADKALLRQRLEALERPAQKVEPAKVEKPDPLLDPEGYEKYLETKFEERRLNADRERSLKQAHKTYKTEFEEAYAAAQRQVDSVLKLKMQTSDDPGETLIEWHREQKTRAEVGTDLNAFRQREQERLLSDPAFLAKAIEKARGAAQSPTGSERVRASAVSLPPSLTRATAASSEIIEDDDISDDALWRHSNA